MVIATRAVSKQAERPSRCHQLCLQSTTLSRANLHGKNCCLTCFSHISVLRASTSTRQKYPLCKNGPTTYMRGESRSLKKREKTKGEEERSYQKIWWFEAFSSQTWIPNKFPATLGVWACLRLLRFQKSPSAGSTTYYFNHFFIF